MERISTLICRWIALAIVALAAVVPVICVAEPHAGSPRVAVDSFIRDAERGELRGEGWLVPTGPARRAVRVQLDGGDGPVIVELDSVRRPDVARAVGRADALDAGWKFQLPIEARQQPQALSLRFLDADGRVLAELASVTVAGAPAEHGAKRHWLVAGFALSLLACGLVLRRLRSADRMAKLVPTMVRDGVHIDALFPSAIVLACALVVGAIVPPFQSPDEFDHVKRAYFLSKGQWLLTAAPGHASGGWVDGGLVDFMHPFQSVASDPELQITRAQLQASLEVGWQGTPRFVEAPGTGYYLPLVYLPQAVALAFGELAGASVDASYRLARLAAGVTAAMLLLAGFQRCRPSAFVMALLLMPMTVFQWAGAGIDALSIGATCLAMALWLESERSGRVPSASRIAVVALLVMTVVGCRIHLAPLLLLPLMMLRPLSSRRVLLGLLPSLLVGAWVAVALATTRHPHQAELSTVDKLLIYVGEPTIVLEQLWATVTTPNLITFYGRSFVGVLGWLDTDLSPTSYAAWALLLGGTLAWSLALANWRDALPCVGLSVAMAAASAFVVLVMLQLMWTPIDAPVIDGIQGRYFILPMLVLAMAIPDGRDDSVRPVDSGVVLAFSCITALYTLIATLPVLVARYYG